MYWGGRSAIGVLSMYCYPKSDPGQAQSRRNHHSIMWFSVAIVAPNALEVNHPCFVVSLIVWTYAAPFSEELTSVSLFPMTSRPSTTRGTAQPIIIRRVDPLCTTELKRKDPIRRVNPSGTTESEGEIPVRRLNPFCTARLQRRMGELLAPRLDRKSWILCLERAVLKKKEMPMNLLGSGERRCRPRCVEIGTLWSKWKSWLWHDCRDVNLVVALTSERDNLVSPPFCNPTQLFSPRTGLTVTNILWWNKTTLSCRPKSSWETKERVLRTPQRSDSTPILPRAIATAATLPEFPLPDTALRPDPDLTATAPAPPSREDMCLRANLCALLLGLVITSSTGCLPRDATLGSLVGLLTVVSADRFTLRNGYGTVEARYHLTAYDCSDPSEVQAYSSIPASHCSTRATPVRKDRPTRFQLLQKERKRYINAYVCSLFRTDIRYNCGVYGHPELDPMHWSFLIPQRVTVEQCLEWLRTRTYRPEYHSTMMHGNISPSPSL